MPALLTLVPITVIAAVLLFVIKEFVEAIRRACADSRKVHALKTLLARECELNLWTIKALRSILIDIPKSDGEHPEIVVRIERRESGSPIARITSADGGLESTRPIPRAHRELMSKYLLDVATLDKKLFQVLEPAYDGIAELEHVRESLVRVHENEEESQMPGLIGSFAEYALEEICCTEEALASLYRHCTGKPLEKHRLR